MNAPNDSPAQPPRRLLFGAAFAAALMAASGGACNNEGVQLRGHTSHDAGLVRAERRQHHAGLHQRRRLHGLDGMASHRALHPVRRADAVFLRHVPFRRRLRRPTGDVSLQGAVACLLRRAPGNACLSGNCRDDSDCPGTVCAPSVGFGAAFYGYVGYYCQTPRDQCRCDADCASPLPSCAYNPRLAPGPARRSAARARPVDATLWRKDRHAQLERFAGSSREEAAAHSCVRGGAGHRLRRRRLQHLDATAGLDGNGGNERRQRQQRRRNERRRRCRGEQLRRGHASRDIRRLHAERRQRHANLHERRRLRGRVRVFRRRALHPVRRPDAVLV